MSAEIERIECNWSVRANDGDQSSELLSVLMWSWLVANITQYNDQNTGLCHLSSGKQFVNATLQTIALERLSWIVLLQELLNLEEGGATNLCSWFSPSKNGDIGVNSSSWFGYFGHKQDGKITKKIVVESCCWFSISVALELQTYHNNTRTIDDQVRTMRSKGLFNFYDVSEYLQLWGTLVKLFKSCLDAESIVLAMCR